MAMPESVLREWELLNEQNQQQARSYISLLLSRQNEEKPRVNPPRRLGLLADRFHGISEDFDAPLPEFEDYQEACKEYEWRLNVAVDPDILQG